MIYLLLLLLIILLIWFLVEISDRKAMALVYEQLVVEIREIRKKQYEDAGWIFTCELLQGDTEKMVAPSEHIVAQHVCNKYNYIDKYDN